MIHPSGKIIRLDEKTHRYFIKNNPCKFTSVTKLLNGFFPKFEREKVAKKYAEKHSLNWKDVAENWSKLGKESAKRGKKYHKFAEHIYENYIIGNYEDTEYGFGNDIIERRMEKLLLKLYCKYFPIKPESIIGSLDLGIAGSVDLIFYSSKELMIADWKFVREIKKDNEWRSALPPIEYLDDCNYSKYCLQLNLYSYIIRKEKYFPNCTNHIMKIFHVTENDIIPIEVPDLQKDTKKLLIEWVNTNG